MRRKADLTLEEQLLNEVDALEKSLDDFDASPADRMAKAKAMDEFAGKQPGKHKEPDADNDGGPSDGDEDNEDEDDGEDEAPPQNTKGKATRKSIMDQLMDAQADLDGSDDFDPEILKALGELDDGDESNAKEMMKAISQQITAQVGVIGESQEAQNQKLETFQKSLIRFTKALTRVQENVTALADAPLGGRRSSRGTGLSQDQFNKAMSLNGQTWDRALAACEKAVQKGMLDSRSASKLETCFNKGMGVLEAQSMFSDIFRTIAPHMELTQ